MRVKNEYQIRLLFVIWGIYRGVNISSFTDFTSVNISYKSHT